MADLIKNFKKYFSFGAYESIYIVRFDHMSQNGESLSNVGVKVALYVACMRQKVVGYYFLNTPGYFEVGASLKY